MKDALIKYPVRHQKVEIRLADLPPPADQYFADRYHAEREGELCYFRFGKIDVRRKVLSTVLELVSTVEAVRQVARTFATSTAPDGKTKGDFLLQLRNAMSERKAVEQPEDKEFISRITDHTKQHSLSASIAVAAYADDAGVLSFYRVPVSSHRATEVPVIPVVRIDTTLTLLCSYCRDVVEFAQQGEQ